VWLSPVQIVLIPVADRHLDYAYKLEAELKKDGIRVELDDQSGTVNYKIRQAQLNKVPYMVIVGDREVTDGTVSVRFRSGQQQNNLPLDSFKETIREAIINRAGN
jgi:threonyl-tRNA synthetase